MSMSAKNHKSSEIFINFVQRTFQCCASVNRKEYLQQGIAQCDAKEIHDRTCPPPDSCCPAGIVCTIDDAWDTGCIQMLQSAFDSNTPMISGIWVVIWISMII